MSSDSYKWTAEPPLIRIRPSRGWVSLRLGDLWEYRELLFFLMWRDVQVRYKQTALGVSWVALQPILTTVVFTVVFGNFAKMPSDSRPYAVFAMAGLVPWTFFSGALTRGSASLVNSSSLVSKVFFPRMIIPLASVLSGLLDLAIVLVVLLGMLLFSGNLPGASIVTLPLFLLLMIAISLGVCFWLAALNVQYRDVNYIAPFIVQVWLYATPVVYPMSLVPERWRILFSLNPLAGVVEGFRWSLFGGDLSMSLVAISVAATVVILVSGAFFFRRMERIFADIV